MSLKYPGEWKFDGIDIALPPKAVQEFIDLIIKIANSQQKTIELFKDAYNGQRESSSYGWAVSDMTSLVEKVSSNAAIFLDYFWQGLESASAIDIVVPSQKTINDILVKHNIPLKLEPPNLLIRTTSDLTITDNVVENLNSSTIIRVNVKCCV